MTLGDKIYDFNIRRPKLYTFIVLIIGVVAGIFGLIGALVLLGVAIIVIPFTWKFHMALKRNAVRNKTHKDTVATLDIDNFDFNQ